MKKTKIVLSILFALTSFNVMAAKEANKEEMLKQLNSSDFSSTVKTVEAQYNAINNPAEKQKFRDGFGQVAAGAVKASLPMKIDPYTTLIGVNYASSVIHYTASITDEKMSKVLAGMSKEELSNINNGLKNQTSGMLCGSNLKVVFSLDMSVKYTYLLKDNKKLTEILISKKDCS